MAKAKPRKTLKWITLQKKAQSLVAARAAKATSRANNAGPAAPTRPRITFTQLLSHQIPDAYASILSNITQTDLNNLQLVTRTIRANLSHKTPATNQHCEALRLPVTDENFEEVEGPRAPCYIFTKPSRQKRVYWCEGPSLNLVGLNNQPLHRPYLPICGTCINEALDQIPPSLCYAYSPLCQPCSLQELSNIAGTNACTCLSPFTSPNVRARLCHDCRDEMHARLRNNQIQMIRTKLPVRDPQIPAVPYDERRYRVRGMRWGMPGWPPGGYRVSCRDCNCNYVDLMNSYLSNPAAGPTHNLPQSHPDYENWFDPEWVFTKGLRLMVFLCLTCDKHVDWSNVMFNRV